MMRIKFLIILFLPLMMYGQPPICPVNPGWTFVGSHSDEFSGKALDTAKWWDFNPAWYGRKPAYFDRANVSVSDGNLILTARAQAPEAVTVENRARGYDQYTTAIVKSKTRVRYGYFEARVKSMDAAVCNAFWLYDPLEPAQKYREGDASEEIDIFEFFGKPAQEDNKRMYFATVHRYETPYVESIVNKKKTKLPDYAFKKRMPFDFQDDFHVYGLLWTEKELVWYVDGEEVFRRANDYFHRPLHIIFDAEIMKDWVGLPDPADLPARMNIDYIRIWTP
jgi:beta-glucanase (GH16 family)